MVAQHVYTYENPTPEKDIQLACGILQDHGVIILPADVNWVLACDASSRIAMERMVRLKPDHPTTQPFSLFCHSISQAAQYALIDHSCYRYLKKMLPGAFTIILPSLRNLAKELDDKRRTVGIRIPKRDLLLSLLPKYPKPLATSSIPCHDLTEPIDGVFFGFQLFESFKHKVDLLLDLSQGVFEDQTTVVDLTSGVPEVLREGAGQIEL